MTTKELYQEARRRYPDAHSIYADVSCQDHAGGLLELWTVLIRDTTEAVICCEYGTSAELCLRNLDESMRRKLANGEGKEATHG